MKKSTAFSAAGSLLIVAFLFFINYITSWGHPWFIYPTFAVLWWPLSMFFAAHKRYKAFAISGSVLTSVFVFLVNYITSWAYPWFIFPVFAIWWWPLSMYTAGQKRYKLFFCRGKPISIGILFRGKLIFGARYGMVHLSGVRGSLVADEPYNMRR